MGTGELLIPPIPAKIWQTDNRAAVSAGAYACVYYSLSGGWFSLSQAGNWSSVPAVGITKGAATSGVTTTFHSLGPIQNAVSGNWNFSGRVGEVVFLGTSSQVVVSSPSVSGNVIQRIGVVKSVDTIDFRPETWYTIYSP